VNGRVKAHLLLTVVYFACFLAGEAQEPAHHFSVALAVFCGLLGLFVNGLQYLGDDRKKKRQQLKDHSDLLTARDDVARRLRKGVGDGVVTAREARRLYAQYKLPPAPPSEQVKALSEQYGLPVITPLQKSEPLPLCTAPPVSAGGPGPVWLRGVSLKAARVDEQAIKEKEYVPAGQDDLLSELDRILREEAGARDGTGYRWFMSPEWLAEVRKLKNRAGGPLYVPRAARTAKWQTAGTLYGYPVTVGESFGVPELKEKP
jgi:hypothetical protein